MLEIYSFGRIGFANRLDKVVQIYRDAYSQPPWNADVTDQRARFNIGFDLQRPGFGAFFACADTKIGAVTWFDSPPVEFIDANADNPNATPEVIDSVSSLLESQGLRDLLYIQETITDPNFAGRGLATALRTRVLRYSEDEFPQGVLVLTRHREDNPGIIKVSEKTGFTPTGIKTLVPGYSDVFNEYWMKAVQSPMVSRQPALAL